MVTGFTVSLYLLISPGTIQSPAQHNAKRSVVSSKLEGNLQTITSHLNTSPESLAVPQIDDPSGLPETVQTGVSY